MSKPELFGTDGIRGRFGEPPLDEATVRALGAALAAELRAHHPSPRAVLGGDTRDSTPILCGWLAGELRAGGVAVDYLGTVPTPAVAAIARWRGAETGVAVSASHNPHPDNGIKLIDGRGFKWAPEAELRLEERLGGGGDPATGEDAELEVDRAAIARYLDSLAATLDSERPLAGLRVVVDAGHGAASPYAGDLFARLGARVEVENAAPDGRNINRGCGSTAPDALAETVVATKADLGIAFDGDADRAIFVDELGEVRDGDAVLFLWGRDLARRDLLPQRQIVATSMSNLGLEVALRREGVGVVRCDVGDRAVVATMQEKGIDLGGEQSGHIVHLALSTTGDGLLTALQVAGLRCREGLPLTELLHGFERYPQLLKNLRVERKPPLETLPRVVAAERDIQDRLGNDGRLVLRYSGTEPLVRIMLEGRDRRTIEALAEELAQVLRAELGAG